MNKKYIVIGAIILVVLGLTVGMMVSNESSQSYGRAANRLPHGYWDTADGYYVDGTAVINGSGVVTGTVSGTVTGTVSGLTTGPSKSPIVTPTASTTLTVAQSGTTFALETANLALTLPTATTSSGVSYKFVISGAFATDNITVTAPEGDLIEGTLIVAGAVVDCDASDVITFVADGENLGDFVEIFSNGVKWFIGQSGALTASKLTCSG